MSAVNLRLTAELKAEAARYAASIGVSLNALVAVAVRDYLDARKLQPAPTASAAVAAQAATPGRTRTPPPPARTQQAASSKPSTASPVPKVGRNDPCPCGSGKKYKQCHGGAL